MFYYFIPRLKCNGKITIDNQSIDVHGQSWYDHEFGGSIKYNINSNNSIHELVDCAWYWFSIQLDNQYDITFTYLFDSINNSPIDKSLLIIGPNNERFEYYDEDQIELQSLNNWFSARTACVYSTKWKLIIPKIKCELYLEAVFNNQEFITILSRPSFWEGRLNVHGFMNNQLVNGYAFFECHGTNINMFKSLDQFFKRISKIVLNNIESILPRQPIYEQAINLIANQENKYLLETLDLEIFSKTIISPLRDIIDRGGKAWRSFLCLVCVDCVGGDSRKFEHWSSLAEILHVGSLIIDDIQDQSNIRRGGPACHLLHGIAQTINSGTAAYFLPLHSLIEQTPQLTTELKLKIYETTFFTLRAAHVGQGLDIHGLDYLMDDIIETGDSLPLEKAILCIHRLKSGVPAGSLARMGAIIGGGTKEQCDVIENYIQSIGVAFQIIDDVLNLRGFENDTKQRGEDIMAGKITFPIAKAMNVTCLSDKSQRKYIWDIIKNKTTDTIIINNLIDLLENCGCINESVIYAKSLIEDAWTKLDPFIPDSFYKIILRAFGFYILERHY
jgi:geranylgeranyl pyrophosphate synthase